MELQVDVTKNGETITYRTLPGDLVAWEQRYGRSLREWATEPPTYSDVAFLAWRSATRGTNPRPSFEDWLDDGITDLGFGTVREGNPTQSDQ